jgi:3-methylfumaryl-CoA hydratase
MMTKRKAQMQIQTDVMDTARADALRITLGLQQPIAAGDPLPPFFHYAYFWDAQLAQDLGRDGHPKLGGFLPDLGLPRRMWAGGRLTFHQALIAGQEAEKRSQVRDVVKKEGRTGPLAFVTVAPEIWQNGHLCVSEEQDLVYREDADPNAPQPTPPSAPMGHDIQTRRFSTTELFRYSALTFNGHRIHYDRDYARDVEGYAGLVVHGPLQAQYLMLMAQEKLGHLTSFEFRGTSALIDTEDATLCWNDGACWVRGADGRICMSAQAT